MKLLEFHQLSGQSHFPPLAAQANFWGTGQGRASFDQQRNCQKINSFMSKFTSTQPHAYSDVELSFDKAQITQLVISW